MTDWDVIMMIRQLDIITKEKEADIIVLDLPLLDTRNDFGDDITKKLILNLVIQVFAYVAEIERHMNHQRTMEGLAAARKRGVKLGRKPMNKPMEFNTIHEQWKKGEISARKGARLLSVSTPTFLKWVKHDKC